MTGVSESDWTALRQEAVQALPDLAEAGGDPSAVMLGYQARLLEMTTAHQVVVVEKSRRIGATWGIAADAVLTAASARSARGMDVLYIGYNLEMTREFIDTCAAWAKAFVFAAMEVGEFVFVDQDKRGAQTQEIKAFRIRFASGFEVVALSSRPRSLRGRQGWVIIDEAAFHDELDELLKAALAFLMWGGRVMVISTHDGVENPFHLLCEDVRAGKLPYAHIKIDFDAALDDGLYRRICLVQGQDWTAAGQEAWRDQIVAFYGDSAREELFCIPRRSGGVWLSRGLIEACVADDIPVVGFRAPAGFVDEGEEARVREVADWCDAALGPVVARMDQHLQTFVGEDFARNGDKTVIWLLQVARDGRRVTRGVIELSDVPYEQQRQILFYVLRRCPRLSRVFMDATGNGGYLAEVARQSFGAAVIEGVALSVRWYDTHTPPFKAAFEDRSLTVPRDENIHSDLRGFKVIDGVARIPKDYRIQGTDGQLRHGDAAIAALLAYCASRAGQGVVYGYRSVRQRGRGDQLERTIQMTGFRAGRGLW